MGTFIVKISSQQSTVVHGGQLCPNVVGVQRPAVLAGYRANHRNKSKCGLLETKGLVCLSLEYKGIGIPKSKIPLRH